MPDLNFILPHWLYWGTLLVFPFIAMFMIARQKRRGAPRRASLFIAYLFWITAGLWGLHRFYLRSLWGAVYLVLMVGVLYCNDIIRDRREDVSRTNSVYERVLHTVERMRPNPGVQLSPEASQRLQNSEAEMAKAKSALDAAAGELGFWRNISRVLAIAIAALLILDAVLLPLLTRRAQARDDAMLANAPPEIAIPDVAQAGTHEDPTLGVHTRVTDAIDWLNGKVGEYVGYWGMIAVFVYYYEVLARYVFNSPTNWVHESMFLMFGMQYMLSGAYAYREDQHVRVDVLYVKLSPRGKAIADIITSVFFFIFILTMLVTGWRFAADAVNNGEVSFTEWAVQYWVVKLTIPLGAGLLALQGLSKLIKDIVFVARGRA
ncbi:MAG TPA: TRAP transporter small permease subunit [Hyphomicrobiaceae bacterium]|jgi:TRAP-type mannitol/chloroaromatic compound transport system permease small subunit|nr:TRAP transporter small permease subunit [Hyphomicrobiaceae bacterium]